MISTHLIDTLKNHGTTAAIIYSDREYTYNSLHEMALGWLDQFQSAGIQSGDIVLLNGDFNPESITALLALWQLKAIVVPFCSTNDQKIEATLSLVNADWNIHTPTRAIRTRAPFSSRQNPHALIQELRSRNHPGLVLLSSGSTGTPKVILHDAESFCSKFQDKGKPIRTITFLMFDHVGGLNTLLYSLIFGGTIIALTSGERTPESVAALIEKHKAEILPTTPTFLNLLLLSDTIRNHNLSSLKRITYGTEPMPESTLKRVNEAFPNITISQTYGLSEFGVPKIYSRDNDNLWIKFGKDGIETKIVNGILHVRTKTAMMGYLNAPSPFDEQGWISTGDAVEVDGEYLRILGRQSDLINIGGLKVYPAEVESVLLEAPNIKDAIVVGESNPITGSMVVAHLCLEQTEPPAELRNRMRAYCHARLEPYQIPKKWNIMTENAYNERFKKLRRIDPS